MSISIKYPSSLDLTVEQAVIPLLPRRTPAKRQTGALAKKMAMEGQVIDEGALYSVKTDNAILHHFHASNSIRWCQIPARGRSHKAAQLDVRDEDELRSIAEKFLSNLGLLDKEASFASIIYGTMQASEEKAKDGSSKMTSAFVNFSYSFEGLPIVGPGAKAQVEIGPRGSVLSYYRFWRNLTHGNEPMRLESRPVISWHAAQKLFSHSPAFAKLNDSAEVIVERARLAYMALPPRDTQGVLFPVYEMRGSVATDAFKKTPFRQYVIALDYSNEDLKKFGVASIHLGGSCRVL
jgi:hypothetical protein